MQQIDKEYDMHLQAWLNHHVTATKEQGSGKNAKQVPVYKKFDDFFDYKKRLKDVEGTKSSRVTPHMKRMAKVAYLVNSGKGVD